MSGKVVPRWFHKTHTHTRLQLARVAGASIGEKSAQKIFATAAAILKAGQEKPQQKGEENAAD